MRQKVKRYSRSAISILLTLCMLVSCMTVGIIATDAAKVSSDEAVGYGDSCRVKGSWDNWTLHELYGTTYSVTLAGNTDYSFVYIADNNDQFAANVTISTSISNYNFSRNDSASITLHTGAAGTYTFSFNGFDGGQTAMSVSIAFPAAATWTVIGACGKSANTTNLFGTEWAPTATANDMTKNGSTYSLTKQYVYLTATDTISYKVAQNHAFTTTYPSANATFSFSGEDYPTGYYDATFTFNENTHAVGLTLTPSTMYTMTVPATVTNAVVTASYGTTTAQEGGTLTNLPPGAKVTVSITPDTGYMTDTVTSSSGCTVSGSNKSWTITLPTAAATSSTASQTFDVEMKTVGTTRLYFNNNASEYNMVSAYVKRSSDDYEPFGVYPGKTMTKMPNSDIWYIDIPSDCDKVIFTGDNGQNTGTTPLTISTSYNPPMYTAGPNKASPQTNGSWGKYYARTNEYKVSKGDTLTNNSNLFTGIKATFYDYYTDGELSGITAGGNDTNESNAGWLKGIANDEFTWRNNGWKWNPYTVLNGALSEYNKNVSNSSTYNNTTYGLYFGNLNVTTGSNPLDMDNASIGRGNSTTIKGYTGWNQNANGSVALGDSHNAATGLSGLTLARGQIHHYKSANTNQNGMDMGMFNEDFLSGWNNANKPLATILRSPVFPVSQRTIGGGYNITRIYLSANNWWANDNAWFEAVFRNDSDPDTDRVIKMNSYGSTGLYYADIPAGYENAEIHFVRKDPATSVVDWNTGKWNEINSLTMPTDNNVVYYTDGGWGTHSSVTVPQYSSHTYYEYDSTDGKDNAYITNISKSGKTAQLNYYNNSNKVYSANNAAGFFPFDYNNLNSHANPSSTTSGDISHDLGFGMKLEIPFTLEEDGQFSDGMHQVFEFSGDDDLWVFVDDHLVLDLGGSHARTEGTIDFADRTVTATKTLTVGGGSRNSSFASWFDNSDPDAIHTMTIYYLERGMYDSNLKFGFSFHAIPNQLKTEKKVRTANINQGFFVDNATTRSDLWIDNRTDHQVTWFEKAFRNDDFIITHKLNGNLISDTTDFTLTRNGYVGASAPATTYTNTDGTVTNGTYKLHNDDVAYFKGAFSSGALMTISETDDNTGGHINQFEYDETVDVYDDANVDSENNSYRFTTVSGTPDAAGTVSGDANNGASFRFSETASTGIENLNIRTRFTNQMQSHDLRITKVSNVPNDTTDFTVNVKFSFDNQEAGVQQGYIAYPLWCEKIATNGTSSSVQLSDTGDATLRPGEILVIPKVPENARVQVSETLASSSDYACTSIKIYDASGNELDFHEGAASSTSGTNVTKSQNFTVGNYDMVAEVNNEVADPVTITHSLHPDSTGTGTCTVTAQVQTSGGDVRATYPESGTTDRVTVPATYIKRGSTDKLVITLNTAPDSPATLEDFYEALNTTIAQLVATGTDYTAVINKASNTATITVNVSALFDDTTNAQKYTTLPFYSKLNLPTYDFNITKTTGGTSTTETFNFEVYKKTGLVYEKITTDPGFTFTGSGTGTFSDGTLTLSPGKTAKFTVMHGETYEVIEVPKGTTLFDYNAAGSSVVSSDSNAVAANAITNGFNEIVVSGNTTVTLANRQKASLYIHKATDSAYDYSTAFKVQILTSEDGVTYTPITNATLNVTKKFGTAEASASTVSRVNNTYEIYKGDRIEVPSISAGTYVRVIETDYASDYYTFGGITSDDVTLTAVAGNDQAKDFVFGSSNANVTITNNFIPQTVKVTKRVYDKTGNVYTNYKYDDGSEFVMKVYFRPKGAGEANYIPLTTGLVSLTGSETPAAPAGGAANGLYTVRKDGYIQFNNVPKGSFIQVDENSVGASPLTGEERFTEEYLVNAGEATSSAAANLSGAYLPVNSNLDLVQRNVVKKNNVSISKSTDSNDTSVDHTITIHIWDNGKPNHKYDGTNEHTATAELSTINYTRTPASGSATSESTTNNTITIHSGDTLTFHYPVGSYYEISETSGALYHMESLTANTENMAHQTTAITDNGVTVPAPVVNATTGDVKFQTKDTAATVTYVNNRDEYSFTIKKTTDVDNTSDEFKVQVFVKDNASAATWTPYTDALTSSKGGTVTADSSNNYVIHKDETLTITGLKANSLVKVVESDAHAPKYRLSGITGITGTTIIEDGANEGGVLMNGNKGVIVDNDVQTTSVTITKTVTGGATGAGVNFPLSVKITNEKTGDTTTTYTCGSYTLTNGTANANVTINGGQTLTINNVPIGATVEVEELSLTGLPYTFTSIDAADANVTNEDKTGQKVTFKTANASAAAVTVTNAVNKHDVTINKVLTNSNNSTAKFKISATVNGVTTWTRSIAGEAAASGSLTDMEITSAQTIVLKDVPVGATVVVSEPTDTEGFSFVSATYSITGSGTTGSNAAEARNVSFTMADSNATVTVNNKINDKTITVKKVTDSGDGSGFKVNVEYQPSNQSNWIVYTGSPFTLAHDGTTTVSIPSDAQIRVTEDLANMPSGYEFESITLNSAATTYSNGNEFAGTTTGTIFVHNTKLRNVNITKATDVSTDSTTTFKVKVETSANGTDWTTVTSLKKGASTVTATDNAFAIKKGETLTLEGVRKGTQIRVTETDTTDSYTFSASGSGVTNVTATPTKDATHKTITFTVDQAADPTVTVDNDAVLKDFTINKTVDVAIESGKSFKLHVQKKALGESAFTDFTDGTISNGVVRFVPGTPITISDQPVGTEFKIWEEFDTNDTDLPIGYSFSGATKTNMDNGTGTVTNGIIVKVAATTSAQSVNFTNTKSSQLIVTKSISGAPADKTFPITIQAVNGTTKTTLDASKVKIYDASGTEITGADKTAKISGDVYSLKNGETVKVDAQMNDQFFVDETLTGNDYLGYRRDGITVSGGTSTNDGDGKQITIGDGNATVTVNNSLITRNIQIKKTVDYAYSNETNFPISVEYYDTVSSTWKTVTGAPTEIQASNDWTNVTLTGQAAVSEIRVTETLNASTTHYGTPTLTVANATKVDGDSSSTAVAFNFDGSNVPQVTIANHAKTANVTVTKELTSGTTTEKFPITVTYTTPGGTATTQTYQLAKDETSTALALPVGTTVTVAEGALTGDLAGYEQDGNITYKVGASTTAQNHTSAYTMTADDVAFTVKNKLKTFTVTIVKEVENEAGTPIADSTDFNININNGGTATTGVINKSAPKTVVLNNVPYGTNVTVTETDLPRGYVRKSINGNGEVTADKTITVTNTKLTTYDVTISKQTDGTPGTKEFGITVSTASAITYSYSVNNAAAQSFTGTTNTYTLQSGQSVVLSGLLAGDILNIQETAVGEDYSFEKFTVNGADNTNATISYTVNSTGNDIVVHNKEVAKYQYEIKYFYESYSAKTYQNNTNLTNDNRVIGADRSYTQTGEISTDDLNKFFDRDVNGALSFKTAALRKEFISQFAPYEDDFMLSLVWDDQNPTEATYDASTKTIKLETRATSKLDREVRVKFKLPYDSDSNLVANSETYLDETQQKPLTTLYGNHVTNSNGDFVTAPLTLKKDGNTTMYFQYWQITSNVEQRNKTNTSTDYKRCYYASFNMTMYQDSYVEAKYTEAQTDYNPSARSYTDTENGEARINYIETSRNQWNNGGDASKYAGDRVYADFLLTFGYQDLALNTMTSGLKAGFVMEQVAELDQEGGKYVTKNESEYAARYEGNDDQKAAREAAVKAYINYKTATYTDDLGGTHTFKLNSTIALSSLDNKNQYKHSVDMSNKVLNNDNTLREGTLKNYVYRAYSYVKLANGDIQLSAPVYFTIYDVATIANGATN